MFHNACNLRMPRPFILVSPTLYQDILFIAPYLTGLKRKKGENSGSC